MEYDFAQLQLEKKSVHCSDSDRITIYGATSCEELFTNAFRPFVLLDHF